MPNTKRRAGPIVAAVLAAAVSQIAGAEVAAPQGAGQPDVRALTSAYPASGQALFLDFATGPGNIVFSPYSIGTAMAMALAGARGDTEREMLAVLQHSLGRAPINDANASAIAALNAYDKSDRRPTCPPGMMLERERCEAKPTAAGNCPFPANRAGEICVATPNFPPSAKLLVASALMLARADVARNMDKALLKDRYAAEVFERAQTSTRSTAG